MTSGENLVVGNALCKDWPKTSEALKLGGARPVQKYFQRERGVMSQERADANMRECQKEAGSNFQLSTAASILRDNYYLE